MTFSANIDRIRRATTRNTEFKIRQNNANAQAEATRRINEASDIANKLSGFSQSLYQWKLEDIERKKIEGEEIFEDVKSEKAKWKLLKDRQLQIQEEKDYWEFAGEVERVKEIDIQIQELNKKLLDAGGEEAYPEVDRLKKLSPWQQVGYLKQKLKGFADTYSDKLNDRLLNSTDPIVVNGVEFTPAQLREASINSLPLKEAAIAVLSKNIQKSSGIHTYSKAMLRHAGVDTAIKDAHKSIMDKERMRFNIEASHNERLKGTKEWNSIPPESRTGTDLYQLYLTQVNGVDGKNNPITNSQAWDAVFDTIVKEAIAKDNPQLIDKYADLEIPHALARRLGVPAGTKFGKHWEPRFDQAKRKYLEGFKDKVTAEKELNNALSENEANKMAEEIRNNNGELSTERLQYYEDQAYKLGGILPTRIKNYKTLSTRDIERDKERILDIMASNNGYIDHETLNQFHPRAANDYRDDADRHTAARQKKFGSTRLIEGALNESWTDAGLKKKEKSVQWEFARVQALQDYENKFNLLVKHGFTHGEANRIALEGLAGAEAVSKATGEKLDTFEGVLAHIEKHGAANKYTAYGEEQNASFNDGLKRVISQDVAKKELQGDPFAEQNSVIGGEYGRARLNEIKENITKHGVWKGIRESENALAYYEGIAINKRGLFAYGLIDAQLKADGHPGIWPNRVNTTDSTGLTNQVTTIQQPLKYGGSIQSYNNVETDTMDLINYYSGRGSVWNEKDNLAGYLQ